MIWRQDREPPYNRKQFIEAQQWALGEPGCPASIPTALDIYLFTAHEAADTVVQILCGQGITRGLGEYQSLWRDDERKRYTSARYIASLHIAIGRCRESIARLRPLGVHPDEQRVFKANLERLKRDEDALQSRLHRGIENTKYARMDTVAIDSDWDSEMHIERRLAFEWDDDNN